jgi:hypothetical protein
MFYENIILGAGPAGLQCGYYFKKHNIPYIIIERNQICGSFFAQYPLSGGLISINKKYTGSDNPEFNLRHDWNSLINDEGLLFTNYSDDFYPKRKELVTYLNDFKEKNELNVMFNTPIYKIDKQEDKYILHVKSTNTYFECKKLIVSTGLSKMVYPNIQLNVKDKIKHYGEYSRHHFIKKKNLDEFKNKKVLIIGGGNASYELANIINEVSSSITILCRKEQKDWALSSHYTGDVRSQYLPFLDTFYLKSLNAIDYVNVPPDTIINQYETNGEYTINSVDKKYDGLSPYHPFGKIIFCTGWKFDESIFNFNINLTDNAKYPKIRKNYESENNKNLFFIGSLMHSLDHKKSSGGFIHGFRYLIYQFIKINYSIPIDKVVFSINSDEDIHKFIKHIMYRINTSSAIYQLYGVMGDIFYYNVKEKQLIYYGDVLVDMRNYTFTDDIICFILTLEYGEQKIENIKELGRRISSIGYENKATLLHPVLKVYNNKKLL